LGIAVGHLQRQEKRYFLEYFVLKIDVKDEAIPNTGWEMWHAEYAQEVQEKGIIAHLQIFSPAFQVLPSVYL